MNVEAARQFYTETLGLAFLREDLSFALVFDANGITIRFVIAKEKPLVAGAVLGWQVPEIESAVDELERAGVRFERYQYMKQDERGIWTSPTGAKIAWFKDPDGNVLSLSQELGTLR